MPRAHVRVSLLFRVACAAGVLLVGIVGAFGFKCRCLLAPGLILAFALVMHVAVSAPELPISCHQAMAHLLCR